jgi:hypothetical protein
VDIEDYQLDPLVRAVQMPRVNLLIADDVGLGKTIEAGLVAQELILRHRARRVLIVCPSPIQIQWQGQMRDKFGLEFHIVDSARMKELRRSRGLHANPWTHFPRLITSIDFIKRERPLRLFRETLPPDGQPTYPRSYDLFVLDEAHNAAPSGKGKYATDSQRTQTLREIVPHFEHKMFLTATPHNGCRESFTALLELRDNPRFARGVEPDRKQLDAVMVRRLKSDLSKRWDGTDRFAKRVLVPLEVGYTEDERRVHGLLQEYGRSRQRTAKDGVESYATEFVMKLLKKRLFSSPAAFAATLDQHQASLRSAKRGSRAPSQRPSVNGLQRQVDQVEEEYADDEEYEETEYEAVEPTSRLFSPLTPEEDRLLGRMSEWAGTPKTGRTAKPRR